MSQPERNDICPCGSGKKFKKCCLNNSSAPQNTEVLSASVILNMLRTSEQSIVSGNFGHAEYLLQQVIETKPNHPLAFFLLGLTQTKQGKNDEAIKSYETAIKQKKTYFQAMGNLAALLSASGKFAEVEMWCRRGLAITPKEVFLLNSLGNAQRSLGQSNRAVESFQKALKIKPDFTEAYDNLGSAFQDLGQYEKAITAYRMGLQTAPNLAELHYKLGSVLQKSEQFDSAVTSYRTALTLLPTLAGAHYNLGTCLHKLGQLEDSTSSYRLALLLNADLVEAHFELGKGYLNLGQFESAANCFYRILEIRPDFVDALTNLGLALHRLKKPLDAAGILHRALELKPDDAKVQNFLGTVLKGLGLFDEATTRYRRALAIEPDFAAAYVNLGSILGQLGEISKAKECLQKAHGLGFNGAWTLDALMLPPIMGTRQEVIASRADIERNLDQLVAKDQLPYDPLISTEATNFYLAFQGMNDRDLQVKIAKYFERACPSLLYSASHCTTAKPKKSKARIGFISSYLSEHSVSYCYSKIIEVLSLKDQYNVSLISNSPIEEKLYSGVATTSRVHLPNNLTQSREMIAALELDILIYLDIGMDPTTYFLAFSRLARVQCVLPGHPVTTGIANLDYFLSNDLMEPADADSHYSEKLIRLSKPLFYLNRPTPPEVYRTRSELGLPENRHIYMCPMKLQKLHPDFDEGIARILQTDENGVVVLFEDHMHPSWKKALMQRFEKTISVNLRERILFVPWMKDKTDFISAIATAEVVLDPFHFGIGSTAMMTFITGTPIVTKAGEFMRGRVGMALCKMMGMTECITEDTETYVQKAVELACNPTLRAALSVKILQNNNVMYDNLEPVDELVEFLGSIANVSAIHA